MGDLVKAIRGFAWFGQLPAGSLEAFSSKDTSTT